MANYVSKHTGAQIDAAVENVGVLDGKVITLSEEMAGQTAPESYGAKGDGVTDDAAAITQALASGQNVVFDGTKTYAVGSTITIPADAFVDFRGATIVPQGNHDVIRVMPGSHISNLIVRCTNVAGWDSSVMVFYAGDKFGAKNPTRISKVKFYNDTSYNDGVENTGNGIYFYTDDFGQTIEGVSVVEAMTSGFRRGVYIKGIDESVDGQGQFSFIGGNNFRGYWSYRDTYGIYIDGRLPNNIIADHFFTDINIQSDYYGGSKHAIYTNGFSCYFSGTLYDYSILDYHPVTAVYFAIGSAKNVVEVTSGKTTKHDYCINEGAISNKVIKRCFDNDLLIPSATWDITMIGNQDDALAFADKRAECTLESIDSEPREGDISCVFNPSPSKVLRYTTYSADTDKCRAVITINLKKVLTRITNLVLQFGHRTAPKSVKVTLYNANEATVILNTQSNLNRVLVLSPQQQEFDYVYDVAKIVVELGGFNIITETSDGRHYGEWVLARIMAVDSYNTGNAWLRRDGGEVYGNVKFPANNGPVLTSADGKKYLLTVSADGVLGTTEWTEQEEETPEVAVLTPVMVAGPAWYNAEASGAAQNTITNVAFDATYEPTGNEDASWACDESGIGDIMAYRNGTEVVIKSTTGSGGVKLNTDSSYMFANDGTKANFAALASITGTETWSADSGTSMDFVLAKNTVITAPVSIPAGVATVAKAFQGCTALLTPPELPEGITTLNNTFASCGVMQYLPEIPSTVANMEYAFHGCKVATSAPSVVPAKVKYLTAAFRNCWKLDDTIEINAQNLTSYNQCFENTSRDGGAVVLTGSCPLLAELAATNTQGKVTVAS